MKRSPIYYIIGNAMEFYDFTIFAFFTPLLGTLFFPSEDRFLSLLFGLMVLAAAFIARPIGGILFGHLGDKFGRKFSLLISLLLMAVSTLAIGLLPVTKKIGIIAPVLLFFLRFTQGLSAGGEYGGVSVLLMELAPSKQRSFWGAFVPMSCGIGALLAAITGVILQTPSFPLWTWRIAFILGGCIGFIALIMRIKVSESPKFKSLLFQKSKQKNNDHIPMVTLLKYYSQPFWKTFLVSSFHSSLISFSFVYINIYLNQYADLPMNESIFYNQFCILAFILSTILFGFFSDFVEKEWVMNVVVALVILFSYPLFLILYNGSTFYIILAECFLGLLAGIYAAFISGYMYNLFPTEVRASGIGIAYSLGVAAAGSTVPITCSLLIKKFNNPMMPAIYLIIFGAVILAMLNCNIRFLKSNLQRGQLWRT
jgi:MHS family proline/betaine transporter-like MFS transporter